MSGHKCKTGYNVRFNKKPDYTMWQKPLKLDERIWLKKNKRYTIFYCIFENPPYGMVFSNVNNGRFPLDNCPSRPIGLAGSKKEMGKVYLPNENMAVNFNSLFMLEACKRFPQ